MSSAVEGHAAEPQDINPLASQQAESPTEAHSLGKQSSGEHEAELRRATIADNKLRNGGLSATALIFACGTALFSDGYVNANSGPTNTIITALSKQNPAKYAGVNLSHFSSLYSSLTFAGTLLGMLVFGVLSDRIGRKFGMLFASVWLSLWSIIIAGSYGVNGSIGGTFAMLEALRFLLGIAIGAEYPAGSVAASENTESPGVNPRRQQMYFVLATNSMIDLGFVTANLVAFILYNIFGDNHLEWVWRLTLGLGAIPPFALFFFRLKMQETDHYKKGAIKKNLPWWLIIKKYWSRLLAVCVAWFIYDYISYPASIYSSYFVDEIVPDPTGNLYKSLGYATLINTFYLPGTIAGALVCDRIGPKNTMIIGLILQSTFGFALAGAFGSLKNNLPGLIIVYGFYVAFGEFGPGNNLGLLASKAVAPSAVRGTFYGIAAGIGKVGAFTGSYLYSDIQLDVVKKPSPPYPAPSDQNIYYSATFYVGASLAAFAAVVVFFFIPPVVQDGMKKMDAEFNEYLIANGYDMSNVGLLDNRSDVEVVNVNAEDDQNQKELNEKKVE